MDKSLSIWAVFFAVVLALLVFDLGLMHRREREMSLQESLWLSCFYVVVSLCFGLFVFQEIGVHQGRDFFTAWLIEKSLSMDNLFVMSLVFGYFNIPRRLQHRVLFWGVLGVLILRGLMIGAGVAIIGQFHFVLYFFGAFLIFTGIKMLFIPDEEEESLEHNKLLGWLRTRIRVTPELHGKKFFVRAPDPKRGGRLVHMATPLFLVLVFIELADIVFAVDSVPAVLAITIDPFVVYTSNIFAILGLRALYFALAAMLHRFAYLKYAIALVLVFIGGKIFAGVLEIHISSATSLAVTAALLVGGVLVSLWKTKGPK